MAEARTGSAAFFSRNPILSFFRAARRSRICACTVASARRRLHRRTDLSIPLLHDIRHGLSRTRQCFRRPEVGNSLKCSLTSLALFTFLTFEGDPVSADYLLDEWSRTSPIRCE